MAECKRCGTGFTPSNGNQRYCTKRCQKAGERERHRAKLVPMTCAHCGAEFMGRRWHDKDAEHKRRYCSAGCDADAKRARYIRPCEHGIVNPRLNCPVCSFIGRAERDGNVAVGHILRGDPCAYCGGKSEARDHITPRVKGGDHGPENRTASCHQCNSLKGTLDLLPALLFIPAAKRYHGLRRALHGS